MKVLAQGCLTFLFAYVASAQSIDPDSNPDRALNNDEINNIFNAYQSRARPTDPCLEALRKIDALERNPLRRGVLYDIYEWECQGRHRVPRMNEDPSSLRR